MTILVLGTHNRKKGEELADLLRPLGFRLQTLAEFPAALEVEETGTTFAENAELKATQQARHLQRWVLAEDSGLEVAALDGAPGVFSARYAGPAATDQDNNEKLLQALRETPPDRRDARYVCHACLADPQGEVAFRCEASCRGRIRSEPAGAGGFGYDPLFEIAEYHRTFAELGSVVKTVLSHRSRALRQLIPQLVALLPSMT